VQRFGHVFREEKEATIALMQDDRDRTLNEIQQLEEQIAVVRFLLMLCNAMTLL
jgi:hypothetical protein